ncbi:hypothetical protein GW17_00052453 [Ensete ventricosum]|nr:hypothetical protein GW17_00052453 [Ensete ventricosum]
MPSAWATAPAAGATTLGWHLTGGRCHLAQALPLQEWSPLYAAALAAGLPLAASQRALPTSAGAALAGASHARGRSRMLATASLQGGLAAVSCPMQSAWPWVVGPVWGLATSAGGLAVANHRRSYIPVFHIKIEKMKEVKRPLLLRYPRNGSLQRNSSNLISQLL